MAKRAPFPPEPVTRPDLGKGRRRPSDGNGLNPQRSHERSVSSTAPPPAPDESADESADETGETSQRVGFPRAARGSGKASNVRPRKRALSSATIDEVTADLSKDPRSEDDEA
jgi:hypothetical protein